MYAARELRVQFEPLRATSGRGLASEPFASRCRESVTVRVPVRFPEPAGEAARRSVTAAGVKIAARQIIRICIRGVRAGRKCTSARAFSLRCLNGKSTYGLCHRIFMGHFREPTSRDLRADAEQTGFNGRIRSGTVGVGTTPSVNTPPFSYRRLCDVGVRGNATTGRARAGGRWVRVARQRRSRSTTLKAIAAWHERKEKYNCAIIWDR
ncbi:hypothetical protein EVAR_20000_1 [Eumeta japonica]|uniref:Uncharacterized protein n=1 Tax=Eumeta variegata TaxID=151549 RepID=A0A4C1VA92_EUMVA|nr:hypothetical protein EVAR_20000_1 [Eumeta japonica]